MVNRYRQAWQPLVLNRQEVDSCTPLTKLLAFPAASAPKIVYTSSPLCAVLRLLALPIPYLARARGGSEGCYLTCSCSATAPRCIFCRCSARKAGQCQLGFGQFCPMCPAHLAMHTRLHGASKCFKPARLVQRKRITGHWHLCTASKACTALHGVPCKAASSTCIRALTLNTRCEAGYFEWY